MFPDFRVCVFLETRNAILQKIRRLASEEEAAFPRMRKLGNAKANGGGSLPIDCVLISEAVLCHLYPGPMTELVAANENIDPFLRADTALAELYRLKRGVLAIPVGRFTPVLWKRRQRVLAQLDESIRICLLEGV